LNSLKSVKALCQDLLATEQRIDYLVCNAGIMALPDHEFTEDGFEKQIGVNLHGHFYMTQLLLPKMKSQSFESRIIVLASSAHNMGSIVPSDLHFKHGRKYNNWVSYGQSKLADILFAKELSDRTEGTAMTACSVHPGVIQTNLWRSSFFAGGLGSTILGSVMSNKTIPQVSESMLLHWLFVVCSLQLWYILGRIEHNVGMSIPQRPDHGQGRLHLRLHTYAAKR
jgi:NAD(P)-dependent dehydrogenase (short-subunit alcohol dehydrogenase family)